MDECTAIGALLAIAFAFVCHCVCQWREDKLYNRDDDEVDPNG